jgi:glycosyltransferase involved in cell wall biosynthesis
MVSNKKIKIAIFVPWIKSKGGVERAILRIAGDKKYETDIFTFFYDLKDTFDDFQKYNVKVIGHSNPNGFIGRGIGLLKSIISTKIPDLEKYDLFLISTAGIAEFITFRNRHKNTVALCHTPLRAAHTMYDYYKGESIKNRILLPFVVRVYKLLEKSAWKRIDYAFVFSNEVRERLINYGLMNKEKIFNLGPQANYPKKNKKAKAEKIIFYPSRFIKYKRQELAIRSFNLSEMPKKGFRLVLGGFVEDREYFEDLKRYEGEKISVRENLSEKELSDLYKKCYVTLFLAINEDTGFTPLESLSYGKPVISVNEGGPKEFIKNEQNGLLVNADEKSIANALNRVIDKRFYAKLKKGAENSTRYDEKRFMKNLENAISSILEKAYK